MNLNYLLFLICFYFLKFKCYLYLNMINNLNLFLFSHNYYNKLVLKTNFHFNQLESIKSQYLKLVRYHDNIINICENRISELLNLLDKTSIDRLYNDIVIDKHILVMNFTNISNIDKYDKLVTALPDMIVNRYKDRNDITVLYSGSIDPDLNSSTLSSDNRFLVDGSFLIEGYSVNINYGQL